MTGGDSLTQDLNIYYNAGGHRLDDHVYCSRTSHDSWCRVRKSSSFFLSLVAC